MSMSISSMSSAAQMLQARDKAFDALDTNKDGVVDANELAAASKKGSESKATSKSDELFGKIDTDGDGKISRAESDAFKQKISDKMKGTLLQLQEQGSPDSSEATSGEEDLFTKLDTNGDGAVDKTEFEAGAKAHGHHHHRPSADDMMAELDADGDGTISKAEFEAGPNRAHSAESAKTNSGSDPASQLLDLLKKIGKGDGASDSSSTRANMVAVLLQVQESAAIAA